MSTALTRVTVSSDGRNIELLLPSDEPVVTLLPRLGEITGFKHSAQSKMALNHVGGPALRDSKSLRDSGVLDGAWLLLTALEDALPEPIVYDVADVVEEELPRISERSPSDHAAILNVSLGALALVASFILFSSFTRAGLYPVGITLALLCWIIAAFLPTGFERISQALTLAPLGVIGWMLLLQPAPAYVTAWIIAGTVLLAQTAQAFNRRSPKVALNVGVVALLIAGTWALALTLAPSRTQAACTAGTVSIIALGFLPRWAISLSGLDRLDDDRAREAKVRRTAVATSLKNAHRSLNGSLLWIAGSLGTASVLIATEKDDGLWGLLLVAVWAIMMFLRMRHFPLTAQKLLIGAAALLSTASLTFVLASSLKAPLFLLITALLLLLLAVALLLSQKIRIPEHTAAQGRILGDRVEFLAALAIIPLVIGSYGVYESFLTTFQK